eukprot:1763383-Rhodomonas_salina.2
MLPAVQSRLSTSSHAAGSMPPSHQQLLCERLGTRLCGTDAGCGTPRRVYCNVQFEQLNKLDKVTYTVRPAPLLCAR